MNTQEYIGELERRSLKGDSNSSLVDYISGLNLTVAMENELLDFVEHHKNGKNLPDIIVSDRQLRDSVQEATQALFQANNPPALFVRNGELVEIKTDETGKPYIKPVGKAALKNKLARSANFFRIRTRITISVTPPDDIAEAIMAQNNNAFPGLADIIECPVLRSDGSIICQPGYDPTTRLFYQPVKDFVMPEIPNNPTLTQIVEATNLIHEIIKDFPFDTEASRANCFAAMFTPILRPMIDGVTPLHLFDKPAPGSGATKLAEVISLIATGHSAAMMAAQKDDEGWRKAIFSLLLRGQSIVTIDNIENTLWTPSLASILTANTFQDRILGKSEMMTFPNRCTWIATGNNIRIAGDLPRRCVLIKIDAKVPQPWRRDPAIFTHPNLLEWVGHERGNILAAMLTIATAWVRSGKPECPNLRQLGGFEAYTKVVGGVLSTMMVTDFLGNLDQMYDEMDSDTPVWDGFLQCWHENIGEEPITVHSLIEWLKSDSQLAETLPDTLAFDEGKGYSRRLGNAISKRKDVVFPSGLLIKKGGEFRKAICWKCVSFAGQTLNI